MIDTLPSYPAYKDSGIPWLGQVPEHWEVTRLSSILSERNETNEKYQVTEVLSVLKDIGVILYSEKGRIGNKKSDDIGRYKIVRPDDIVLNSMNVIIGSVGRSKYVGCLSPVYYVLRLRNTTNLSTYFETVFRNKLFQLSLVRIGNGILSHRMRIPMEKLKAELVPLPPPAEQAAIVRFLEWAGGRLERTIRAKRKIITLLNEQKQAIIHRAVTRGLDPDVPLKDSGIPWLGEIPAHWEVVPSKALFKQRREKARDEDEILTASQSHGIISRSKFMELEGRRVMQVFIGSDILKHIEPNDFVMSMRSFEGGLEWSHISGSVSSAYVALIPASSVHCPYFAYALKSKFYISDLRRTSDLVRDGQALRYFNFGKVALPLVPWSEQVDIAKYIDQKCDVIHSTISRLEREIELLREYRTRLISDVVTGKLDVRAAAATLPDEPSIDNLVAAHDVLADEADEALDTTEDV